MILRILLASFVVVLTHSDSVSALWPFPSKRFSANAFVDAQSLGLEDAGRVVAFGDFDGDQFLDVVAMPTSSNQKLLEVWTWNHNSWTYQKNSTLQSPNGDPIVSVVPGDYTHSGRLDLMIMTQSGSRINSFVFEGTGRGFEAGPLSVPPSTLAQPIPLDYNGNLHLDLLGNTRSTTPSGESDLVVWKNVYQDTGGQILFDTEPFQGVSQLNTSTSSAPKCLLPTPHSSSVVDLNGDCLADLFLVCKDPTNTDRQIYQIWLNNPDGSGYTLTRSGNLPKGAGMVSWGDMNRDGALDMVFPTCDSVDANGVGHGCKINIAYNKQMGFCNGNEKKGQLCRRPEALCKADPSFDFDLSEGSESLTAISLLNLLHYSSLDPEMQTDALLMLDTTFSPPIPQAIKIGDADLDGFPDLLFIVVTPGGNTIPKLAWNIRCELGEPGCSPLPQSTLQARILSKQGGWFKRGLNLFARVVTGNWKEADFAIGGHFSGERRDTPVEPNLEDAIFDDDSTLKLNQARGFVIASSGGDASVLSNFHDARSVSFLDLDEDGTLDILVQRTGRQSQQKEKRTEDGGGSHKRTEDKGGSHKRIEDSRGSKKRNVGTMGKVAPDSADGGGVDTAGWGADWPSSAAKRSSAEEHEMLKRDDGTYWKRASEGNGPKINFVQNNVFHDAFFMKAIVLNGACGGMCAPKGELAYHPFGVSYPGATYKYTILSTTGKRSAAAVAQLPQTAYHALLTPYSFFGLGRTNNYIEELFVGSTRKAQPSSKRSLLGRVTLEEVQMRAAINTTDNVKPITGSGEGLYYINMEGVIPNSKVVIIPPDQASHIADGDWKRELYLRPGEWIPWVSVCVVITVVLLGLLVWAFWWNERREDELERRRALHSINFDAL